MLLDRIYRSVSGRPQVVDAVLAAALLLVLALPYAASDGWLTLVLSLPLLAPLAWRRSLPVLAATTVFAGAFVQWLLSVRSSPLALLPADLGVLLALYSLAGYGPRWASRAGLATGLLGAALLGVRGPGVAAPGPFDLGAAAVAFVAVAGVVLATWTSGDLRRIRRQQVEGLRERAARLELEREQEARLAAAGAGPDRARAARRRRALPVGGHRPGRRRSLRGDSPPRSRGARAPDDRRHRPYGPSRPPPRARRAARAAGGGASGYGAAARPGGGTGAGRRRARQRAARGAGRGGAAASAARRPGARRVPRRAGGADQRAQARRARHGDHGGAVLAAGRAARAVDDEGGRGAAPDGRGHGLRGVQERAGLFGGTAQAGPRDEGGFRPRVRLPYP